ncbi:MAG: twin-arginine translocase subunit TatC [Bacteroidales bacterium]
MDKKKLKNKDANDMTFLEHLEVLRGHLLRSIASVGFFAVIVFIFTKFIFDHILLAPKSVDFITNRLLCKLGHLVHTDKLCINDLPLQLINIEMAGQFRINMTIALYGGLILSAPYILWELYRFIMPALEAKERRYSSGMVFYTTFLFMLGVLFGYFLITPLTINFLGTYSVSNEVLNQINLKSYIGIITSLVFASGLIFELPILVYFLSKVGIVTPGYMRKYRKHALIVILVIAGIITPPDIFSQVMVTIPMYALFEVSIFISARIEKQRDAREAADE